MSNIKNDIVIETKNLTKWFDKNLAINDVSLSLQRNKIYGFLGRNGSGKSTLISLLAQELQPDSGEIIMSDSLKIAKVSNDLAFPGFISLEQITTLFSASKQIWDADRYYRVLEIFELEKEYKFTELSTGERAGVMLATLIAQKADLWLMDEATLGLDIVSQFNCLTALLEYFAEDAPCILYCSHNLSEIERLADDIIIMNSGRIEWFGDIDSVYVLDDSESENSPDKLTFSQSIFNRFKATKESDA